METHGYTKDQNQNSNFNYNQNNPYRSEKKIPAAILALIIPLGIHKLLLGYTNEGILQIILTIITCGLFGLVSYIEGILYLFKSDKEFDDTYVYGRKPWL